MNKKRQYKTYPKVFKEEAVALVLEQGYSVPEAAQSLNIKDTLLYNWKKKHEEESSGSVTRLSSCVR
jgi:transposase